MSGTCGDFGKTLARGAGGWPGLRFLPESGSVILNGYAHGQMLATGDEWE